MRLKILKNFIRGSWHGPDVIMQETLENLKKWNVSRLDELLDLIHYIKKNNILDTTSKYAWDLWDEVLKSGFYNYDYKKIPFFNSAMDILGGVNLPIYINKYRFADYSSLEAIRYIIATNYYIHTSKNLFDIVEKCYKGDFLICLTLFVEDYKNVDEVPHHYKNTLRKIKGLSWQDEDADNLDTEIISYLAHVFSEDSYEFFNNFKFGALYLMACSAVKHNRDVSCEDVVIGYLLVFQFLCEDLTPYVEKYYDEEKIRFRENLL